MSERWEYLAVIWIYSVEHTGDEPIQRQQFQIHRGTGDDEKRHFLSSEKPGEKGPSLIDLFNELGAEGWELVSDAVQYTKIFEEAEGWSEVGAPLRHQYMLKRRLGDD